MDLCKELLEPYYIVSVGALTVTASAAIGIIVGRKVSQKVDATIGEPVEKKIPHNRLIEGRTVRRIVTVTLSGAVSGATSGLCSRVLSQLQGAKDFTMLSIFKNASIGLGIGLFSGLVVGIISKDNDTAGIATKHSHVIAICISASLTAVAVS